MEKAALAWSFGEHRDIEEASGILSLLTHLLWSTEPH